MRTTCKACATPAIAARQPDQTVVGGRAGQISTMPALCTGRLAKRIHPRNQTRGVESAEYNRGGYKPRIYRPGGYNPRNSRGV